MPGSLASASCSKVVRIVLSDDDDRRGNDGIIFYTKNGKRFVTKYLINAAVGIAHSMKAAMEYADLHFREEYWQAPSEYPDLTKLSIYTVPKYPDSAQFHVVAFFYFN